MQNFATTLINHTGCIQQTFLATPRFGESALLVAAAAQWQRRRRRMSTYSLSVLETAHFLPPRLPSFLPSQRPPQRRHIFLFFPLPPFRLRSARLHRVREFHLREDIYVGLV